MKINIVDGVTKLTLEPTDVIEPSENSVESILERWKSTVIPKQPWTIEGVFLFHLGKRLNELEKLIVKASRDSIAGLGCPPELIEEARKIENKETLSVTFTEGT